jgi:hypothetical protein
MGISPDILAVVRISEALEAITVISPTAEG